jgi:DNA polymerase III alpha subunit
MIDLGNRVILNDGTVICDDSALVEMLYQEQSFDLVVARPSNNVELFNRTVKSMDMAYSTIATATECQYESVRWFDHWLTPEQYKTVDIAQFCYERCGTVEEIERVQYELSLFEERDMVPVLQHLIYMVDHLRANDVVWGVGRGSSVSSFILFLIGINRINPLKFGLDVREFLK